MKVACSSHVDISAPVERVFDFVSEIAKWPVWFGFIVSAQQPDHRPLALKEEIHLCLHARRRRWHEAFEVTRLVRNAFLSIEGAYSTSRRIDFRFEQRGGHTRVACAVGYPVYGGWIPALADVMFTRPAIARDLRESLVKLRCALEEIPEVLSLPAEEEFARAAEQGPEQHSPLGGSVEPVGAA